MKTPTLALAVIAVLALAGCSTATPARPAATASGPAAATSAPATAPSPTIAVHPFGQTVTLDALANATVYGYRQPAATTAPKPDQPGYEWAAVDVKVCAGTGAGQSQRGIVVSRQPWALVYADDTQVRPSDFGYGAFPQPAYAWGEQALLWGRCLRGWIVFPVPAGKRPTMVEYQPGSGSPVAGQTADWTVPVK